MSSDNGGEGVTLGNRPHRMVPAGGKWHLSYDMDALPGDCIHTVCEQDLTVAEPRRAAAWPNCKDCH